MIYSLLALEPEQFNASFAENVVLVVNSVPSSNNNVQLYLNKINLTLTFSVVKLNM